MSGLSNVTHWLKEHGYPQDRELAEAVFQRAKESRSVLTAVEIEEICAAHGAAREKVSA